MTHCPETFLILISLFYFSPSTLLFLGTPNDGLALCHLSFGVFFADTLTGVPHGELIRYMNIPIFLLGLIAITVGGTLAVIMTYRAKRMIYAWADSHRYQILHLEWRWVRLGPYFLKSSKNQMIYRVKLQKQNGQISHCWVRCGSWILGVLINEIDVIWDQV